MNSLNSLCLNRKILNSNGNNALISSRTSGINCNFATKSSKTINFTGFYGINYKTEYDIVGRNRFKNPKIDHLPAQETQIEIPLNFNKSGHITLYADKKSNLHTEKKSPEDKPFLNIVKKRSLSFLIKNISDEPITSNSISGIQKLAPNKFTIFIFGKTFFKPDKGELFLNNDKYFFMYGKKAFIIVEKNKSKHEAEYKLLGMSEYEFIKKYCDELNTKNFEQNDLGDCSFIASLKAILSTKKGKELVENYMEKGPEGEICVTFPGKPHLRIKNLFPLMERGINNNIKAKIIENAFAKFKQNTLSGNSFNCLKSIISCAQFEVPKFDRAEFIESLYLDSNLKILTGKKVTHHRFFPLPSLNTINKILENLDEISNNPGRFAVAANTRTLEKDLKCSDLSCRHSYTILNVDSNNKKITISDPRYSDKVKVIDYDTFFENFSTFYMVDMES